MNCDETRPLLEAYLDGELDLVHSLAMEQHVEACVDCRLRRDQLQALRELVRRQLPREAAPAILSGRVRAALRGEVAAASRGAAPERIRFSSRWPAAAALALAAFAFLVVMQRQRPTSTDPLVAEAVSNHVRSLLPGHLTDVESTDQHTVKPWVAQRIDYSPPVLDFASDGYPLAGARMDYLGNRKVAALVYRCRKHVINVFVSPDSETGAEPMKSRDGFHVGVWYAAGMKFVVVSDLAEPELRTFCDKYRAGLL